MKTINPKNCPEDILLEAFITKELSLSERNQVFSHLQLCHKCWGKYCELQRFYSIFWNELQKPVSSLTFELINNLEPDKYHIAGIILIPKNSTKSTVSKQYNSQLISTNSNREKLPIEDLDCIPVDENELFIRAIQSKETQYTFLYLFAHKKNLYQNVNLYIHSIGEKFESDGIGRVDFKKYGIHELNNTIVTIDNAGSGE